jgi:hypothetical protein
LIALGGHTRRCAHSHRPRGRIPPERRALPAMRVFDQLHVVQTSLPPVSAEEIRDYYAEPGLNPFEDTASQHFNEHVAPFSGTLQLKYVDLS